MRIGFTRRNDGRLTWADKPGVKKRLPFYLSFHIGPWALAIFRYESDGERYRIIEPGEDE